MSNMEHRYLVLSENEVNCLMHTDEVREIMWAISAYFSGKNAKDILEDKECKVILSDTGTALAASIVGHGEHNLSDICVAVYADLLEKQEKH